MKKAILALTIVTILFATLPVYAEDIQIQVIGASEEANRNQDSYIGDGEALSVGEKYKVDGNYSVEYESSFWGSDDTLRQGFFIGYVESKENDVDAKDYVYPIGTHTPTQINILFTNMSKNDTEVLERVSCKLIYDEEYIFDTMAVIYNPNQTVNGELDGYESSGMTGYPSTEGLPVEPLVTVSVAFISAIPLAVRDSDKPFFAQLTIDGTDIYSINLRDTIELK